MQREEKKNQLHIVMFPWHAFGHISPFIQLSNKLSLHGLQISFFSATGNIPRIKSSLNLLPNVQIIPLSIPDVPGLSPDLHNTSQMTPAMAELLKQASDLMQPQIHDILSHLKPHFIIFDLILDWIPKIAAELGIKRISFSVFSAIAGAYLTVPARLISGHTLDDLTKPPDGFPATSVTCVKRFQARDFLYMFKSFDGRPGVFYRVIDCLRSCDAVAMKTCEEMEGPYVDFMKTQFQKPIHLTGPLVPDPLSGVLEEKWANWLGQFPDKAVVFCSFGSETFMNQEQIREIALGLELTGSPFFLVLNFPGGVDGLAELEKALPKGFVERVKGKGLVHVGWVPQQLILAHKSVGCYVCHSGFSSVIEALMNDCRLVLLPFKGDQFLNSKLIALDLKAGVEVNREEEEGYFGKEDICEAVKTAMADDGSIKENHEKWREFLVNEEIHKKFIADLVEQMKAML
ncbi:anthocyanidin 3-O-glucosyltransferase-like [Carica papaya]|uniref:anthocyanidin 3-O-glucosyltransferase-like n=1 Tax=Carica papaya TaxID=3649 RepID=UPI000B8CC162|nr:anthocyanidin 3-O-glucosyltransferase-like [Carica papaya]